MSVIILLMPLLRKTKKKKEKMSKEFDCYLMTFQNNLVAKAAATSCCDVLMIDEINYDPTLIYDTLCNAMRVRIRETFCLPLIVV